MNSGAQAYRSLGVSTQIDGADQHALIQMLFDGGIERLRRARGCINRGEVANRNEALNAVVAIVAGLQGSLDHELGGDLASNLDALYDYMQRRLLRANMDDDAKAVDEVLDLLRTLRDAWSAISAASQTTNG